MDKTFSLDKKSILYLSIVLLSFVAAFSLIIWGLVFMSFEENVVGIQKTKEQLLIESQLKELERVRKETPELTQEQLDKQMKELDKVREGQPSLSESQIQKQLEELDRIRQQ